MQIKTHRCGIAPILMVFISCGLWGGEVIDGTPKTGPQMEAIQTTVTVCLRNGKRLVGIPLMSGARGIMLLIEKKDRFIPSAEIVRVVEDNQKQNEADAKNTLITLTETPDTASLVKTHRLGLQTGEFVILPDATTEENTATESHPIRIEKDRLSVPRPLPLQEKTRKNDGFDRLPLLEPTQTTKGKKKELKK